VDPIPDDALQNQILKAEDISLGEITLRELSGLLYVHVFKCKPVLPEQTHIYAFNRTDGGGGGGRRAHLGGFEKSLELRTFVGFITGVQSL
jgi:hypothetical protein